MIEKKLRKRSLKEEPALVIAAFGSRKKGKVVYELCDAILKKELGQYKITWAYTSEIIREKNSQAGILEALSYLEAKGYRKAIVQPLHIFHATEYSVLNDICRAFPGMRVVMGETLLHRWSFVKEVLHIISKDFLTPEVGINVVVAHGTPLCADPANAIYLGINHLFTQNYDNVFLSTTEGIPGSEILFNKLSAIAKKERKRVRIIPFMYVAGLHVEEDLLGPDESYKNRLEDMGYEVDILSVNYNSNTYLMGLGFFDEIPHIFSSRIKRALELTWFY